MECDRFVHEKVGDVESPEFRDHLIDCVGCQRDLEEIDEIRDLYREASTERYGAGVPRARRRPAASWLSLASAAVMIGVLVMLMWPAPPASTPQPAGGETPVVVHIPLEPWGREDAQFNRELEELWVRLEDLKRSRR